MSEWEDRYVHAMSGWHEACELARRGMGAPGYKPHLQMESGRWLVSYLSAERQKQSLADMAAASWRDGASTVVGRHLDKALGGMG